MVCEAFGCPPDVAERQDWALVTAVLEYRAAKAAIDLFNAGSRGVAELQKQPGLVALLLEINRAQGAPTTEAALMADMAGRGGE